MTDCMRLRVCVASPMRPMRKVAIACSVAGAATGNALGNAVDASFPNGLVSPDIPTGTLVCNVLFALLGTSLNALTLRHRSWGRSVLLQS